MSALFFIFEAVKTNWLYRTVKYLKKFYFRNDKRVAAYFVCLIIATGFWFLNALSKTYTADIVAPVVYTNLPANKTLVSQLPEKLDMTVKAHGFTILRHKISFLFMPIDFNVNEMTNDRMTTGRRTSFSFPSAMFLSELSYQLSNDMEILSINPDTLFFNFGQVRQQKVKVKPSGAVKLKKQYQVSGEIQVVPDSVTVSAPQAVIDTIHFAYTKELGGNDIDKNIDAEVELKQSGQFFFEPNKVKMVVPVEEYTETEQLIPIQVAGQPENVRIKLFPAKARVTFQVALSRFSNIRPEDFKLRVSYDDILAGKKHLSVKKEGVPPHIYELKLIPQEVEYLIEN